MGGGLHFLVEIETRLVKMPAFTNLKRLINHLHKPSNYRQIPKGNFLTPVRGNQGPGSREQKPK